MHYNHLTTLPPEIGDFAHLEKLFLSHNALMSLPPLCLSSAEEVS
jgi:Leucine-rich repeat (LRR) protein